MAVHLATPPNVDELEVSLFGPGVGECVVVHLGGGEWMIVDSCVDRDAGVPVALRYLEELGLTAARAISSVVITHWHDDHMAGASRVLKAAKNAKFFCSAALSHREFLKLVAVDQKLMLKSATATTGTSEFSAIIRTLLERRIALQRPSGVGPEWAKENTLIYRRPVSIGTPDCEIMALAPSSAAVTRGLRGIASILPIAGQTKLAAVNVDPNETSLVLAVRVGKAIALLGADLEANADPSTGWNAVLGAPGAQGLKAQLFKVPHHGSENAHHRKVWSDLLELNPHAVLTPFATGKKFLPSKNDVERIKSLTPNAYISSRPAPTASVPLDRVVERTVREVASSFRARIGRMGHIRVRMSAATGIPTVELFGAAHAA